MKLFTMKLTDEERSILEERAGGRPLATYIKEGVLAGGASETRVDDESDGMDFLLKLMKRFDSPDHFVECLCARLGESLPERIEVVLKTKPVLEEVEKGIQVEYDPTEIFRHG